MTDTEFLAKILVDLHGSSLLDIPMKSIWFTMLIIAAAPDLWMTQANSDETSNTQARAADSMRGQSPGEIRDDNFLKMKLVWCPPGAIKMEGVEFTTEPIPADDKTDDDYDRVVDKPVHVPRIKKKIVPVKVFLTHGYWIGKYEVTKSEWTQLMAVEQKDDNESSDNFPATQMSWDEAMQFCEKFTERERTAGRLPEAWEYTLPTEAQWERACRARAATKYCFGDDESELVHYAWFKKNAQDAGDPAPHRVGLKKPNAWGLYDMHGNAWEWCRDIFVETLPGGRDPEVTDGGTTRVIRGASCRGTAEGCRSSHRLIYQNSPHGSEIGGFRVALRQSSQK